jgi:hypothetical protein
MQFTVAQAVLQLPDSTNAAAAFVSPIDQTILTPAVGPVTGSRIDLIVGKQNDPQNADPDARASFSLIAGTAGTPGFAPAVPAGFFRYADIEVPTNAANAAACTVTLKSPTTFAPVDLLAPTYALLSTVTGQPGQHATVTADGTAANNGDYVWIPGSPGAWRRGGPVAMAAGVVTSGSNTTGVVAITFPAGRFAVPPVLFFTATNYSANVVVGLPGSVTTSGANVSSYNIATGANVSGIGFTWTAIQMSPTTAAG